MFTRQELKTIAKEARAFADMADALITEGDQQPHWNPDVRRHEAGPNWFQHGGTALSGTFRRRSMDLSRALIALRRP